MRKLPILSVVRTGSPEFERYLIEDDQCRLWTGEEFGDAGILYAARNHAIGDVHSILKSHFDTPPVRYEAPVVIEVYGDVPVEKVALYLSQASRLHLATSKFGNGPGSSLVLPTIEWSGIKPLERSDDE
jgi:hypothetical protein